MLLQLLHPDDEPVDLFSVNYRPLSEADIAAILRNTTTSIPGRHSDDVLSAWPLIGDGNNQIVWQKCKLAMAVRGSSNYYLMSKIQRRHWIRHGETVRFEKQQVEMMLDDIIGRTPEMIKRVTALLPVGFPAGVAEGIFNGTAGSVGKIN